MKLSPKNLYLPKETSKLKTYSGKKGDVKESVQAPEGDLSFRDLLSRTYKEMYMGKLDDALTDIETLGQMAETTPTTDEEFYFMMYLCARTASCTLNLVSSDTVFSMMKSKLENYLPIAEYPAEWFLYYYEFGNYNDILCNKEITEQYWTKARSLFDRILPKIHYGTTYLLRDISVLANCIEDELFTSESGQQEILSRYNNLLLMTDGLDDNNPDVQYARSVAYTGLGDYSYSFQDTISSDEISEMKRLYSLAEKEISLAIEYENSQNMYSLNQLNNIKISRLFLLYIEDPEDLADKALTLLDEALDIIEKIEAIDSEYALRRTAHFYWSFGSCYSYKEYLEKAAELFRIGLKGHPDIQYFKDNIAKIANEISELE